MKLLNKIHIVILVIVVFVFIILFGFFTVVEFFSDYSVSDNKTENYLEEKNNTIIASGMDGYIFKINDNVLFHTLDENIEIKKTDLTFNKDYSDLVAN